MAPTSSRLHTTNQQEMTTGSAPIPIPRASPLIGHVDDTSDKFFRPIDWKTTSPDLRFEPSSSTLVSHAEASKTKDFLRQKCGKFSRAIRDCSHLVARGRRSSNASDSMEGIEHSESSNPPSPALSQHKGFSRLGPTKNKFITTLKGSRHDTPIPLNTSEAMIKASSRRGLFAQDAGPSPSSQVSPHSLFSKTGNRREMLEMARQRISSNPGASDSGADLASSLSMDYEMEDVDDSPVDVKFDPVAVLPTEIVALVFSHLDVATLKKARAVSRAWAPIAVDPLIWRCQYLSKYHKQVFVEPAPIQIGGVGVGHAKEPAQRWEEMYDARQKIDRNWAKGDLGGKGIYLSGHTDSVYCVQFDEKKIITGSRDRTIRVWDIETYKCIKVIGGPNVRPTPGPKVLRTIEYPRFHHAEASVNGTAYGNSIYQVPSDFHGASILCLQYDDEILVTGSSDNDLLVWNVETYEPIKRLKQHTGGVLDVTFDAKHIVSCSKDCTIVVWDRKTLEPLRTLAGHRGPVNAVQLRGNLLVSASGDGVARLWDLTKMKCIREFPPKERGLAAVEFSDDAKFVLAGGNDHITYKFDVETGAEVKMFKGHSQLVRSLFLDTQNRRVISGSYDLDLRVYDYDSGELLGHFKEWTTSWMLAAKCDYRRIVSTSQDGRILLIDFGLDEKGDVIPGVELLKGC